MLKTHTDATGGGFFGEAQAGIAQQLVLAHLQQQGRQAVQVGIDRGNPRLQRIDAGRAIAGVGLFQPGGVVQGIACGRLVSLHAGEVHHRGQAEQGGGLADGLFTQAQAGNQSQIAAG